MYVVTGENMEMKKKFFQGGKFYQNYFLFVEKHEEKLIKNSKNLINKGGKVNFNIFLSVLLIKINVEIKYEETNEENNADSKESTKSIEETKFEKVE
jgi:hypothetical protein